MTLPKNRPGRSRWLIREDAGGVTQFVVEFERGRIVHANAKDLYDLIADAEQLLAKAAKKCPAVKEIGRHLRRKEYKPNDTRCDSCGVDLIDPMGKGLVGADVTPRKPFKPEAGRDD